MPDSGRKRPRKVVEGPWLTPEDVRMLELLAQDLTAEEVAEELGISPSAVKDRVESIFNKMREQAGNGSHPPSIA